MTYSNDEELVFETLLEYLRQVRGFDFTGYKRSSLQRRVRKRMQEQGIEEFGDYLDYLQVHPGEFSALFNTILINVTSFFRDLSAWNYLQQEIIPNLLSNKATTQQVRVWSAGCASGEEVCTIAIVLAEAMGVENFRQRVKIYATDVDEEALEQGRQARYSAKSLEAVPQALRQRYFIPVGDQYTFSPELRRAIIFGRHDLVKDAPISRLDLLLCRNTLMYFNAETQKQILNRFYFALTNTGFLFLGKAEMLLTHGNLFTPVNLQHRVFTKVPQESDRQQPLATSNNLDDPASRITRYLRLREQAFDAVPYPQLIIDTRGRLVLANLSAQQTFSIALRDLGRPLQDLEVSYRPLELRALLKRVREQRDLVSVTDVQYRNSDDDTQYYDIQLLPLEESDGELLGFSIVFINVTRYHQLQEELQRANQELETANEELQSSNEELETTNEELQSTNEELETTNEELQSSNEELETTNEELQSTNEELQTINDELRIRTTELNQANAFLSSILESLQAGVIVVDRQFNILSWNHKAEDLWGLRADEVQEQSLLGLDIGLPVEQLGEPLRNCLSRNQERQEMRLRATNRRGQTIQCYLSFTPLIGSTGERLGVIVLMEEEQYTDS